MDIGQQVIAGITVVTIGGRIDPMNALRLQAALQAVVDQGAGRVVLDCAALDYVSSAGLGAFLAVGKSLGHGRLSFCGLNAHVRRIFDIAGLAPLFTFYPEREQALAAGGQGGL